LTDILFEAFLNVKQRRKMVKSYFLCKKTTTAEEACQVRTLTPSKLFTIVNERKRQQEEIAPCK